MFTFTSNSFKRASFPPKISIFSYLALNPFASIFLTSSKIRLETSKFSLIYFLQLN